MNMKKVNVFVTIVIAMMAVAMYSCDQTNESLLTGDDELISAIALAARQEVSITDIPVSAQDVLNSDFSSDLIVKAEIAPDLGYQLGLVKNNGVLMGQVSQAYFNLQGRMLEGNGSARLDGRRGKVHGGAGKACFKLVFPISLTLPDGTAVVLDNQEGWRDVHDWYRDNPEYEEKPQIIFPIDIVYNADSTVTIDSEEAFAAANEACEGLRKEKNRCFEYVLPISFTMPDGSTINVAEEADYDLIRDWHDANPDVEGKGTVNLPVDVVMADGSAASISTLEELEALEATCKPEKNGKGKRCFEYVLPISYTMPDGTIISVAQEEDFGLLKDWHEANPEVTERGSVNFPVDVLTTDGNTITIGSEEELKELESGCPADDGSRGKGKGKGHGGKG
jgi:hypothetical protein